MYNTTRIERMPFLEIFIGCDPLQIPIDSKVAISERLAEL